MNLKPIGDRVIVERAKTEDKTAGGIVLPGNAQKKPQRGTILAVGPGKLQKDGSRKAMQVKVGDTVLFTSWAGDEYKDKKLNRDILVMHEEDILAVLD